MDIISGANAIREMLTRQDLSGSVLHLLAGGKGKASELEIAASGCRGLRVVKSDSAKLRALCPNHKGAVLALADGVRLCPNMTTVREYCRETVGVGKSLALVLDCVSDPQNLGGIIRTCDCFAVDLVVLARSNAAGLTPTVYSVSQGALEHVKVAVSANLSRDIEEMKRNGHWVYAADMGGVSIYQTDFASRSVLVMGREGSGLRSLVARSCDASFSIPMRGHLDSLNVSVAAAVSVSEFRRRVGY